jgi:hypothetical protein
MTGGEDQRQHFVTYVVVYGGEHGFVVVAALAALRLYFLLDLVVLACGQLAVAQQIERAMFRGGHEPRRGFVRDALVRPLLESRDERVLRQLLGHAHVANDLRQTRDDFGGLDPEHGLDGAPCVRIGPRGSAHARLPLHLQNVELDLA